MSTTTETTRTPVAFLDLSGMVRVPNETVLEQGETVRMFVTARVTGISTRESYTPGVGDSVRTGFALDVVEANIPGQPELLADPIAAKAEPSLAATVRRIAWGFVAWAAVMAPPVGAMIWGHVEHNRAMDRCTAQFKTQFVGEPDGRAVWTSPACAGLSISDMAKVHSRTVVEYQRDAERARTAAEAKG